MGTSLFSIGNHNILFKNREYREIAEEIRLKLEDLDLHNSPFLMHHLLWEAHIYDWKETREEILKKKDWTYNEEADLINYHEYKSIELYGPLDLEIDFRENSMMFWQPSFNYWNWFEPHIKLLRDEWRKYMFRIVKHFGGDRVVYLADNGHNLQEFMFYEGTFEEMEEGLLKSFGKPQKTFSGVMSDYDNAYFIDYFDDLNFNEEVDLDKILPLDSPKLIIPRSNYFNT